MGSLLTQIGALVVPSPNDYASIRTVIENYIKGSYTADTDLLKRCFHPDGGCRGLTIRDLMGHSSVAMTDRCMHSDQADVYDAVYKSLYLIL